MMTQPDEQALDSEMKALLRADFAPASAASKDRVSNRIVQSLGSAALSRVAGRAQTPVRARPLAAALRAHPAGFITSFALGAAVASGLYAAVRRPEPVRIVYVDRARSAAALAPDVQTGPPNTASSDAQPASVMPAVDSVQTAAAPRSPASGLAEQQRLLDAARIAFARDDYPATLEALAAHFQRYPKSILGEEREALEIKALAASGHESEAKTRAARFEARFPQSLLLPSVRGSVGTIP